MDAPVTYRARFRFRLLKKIDINAKEHHLEVAARRVVISGQNPDLAIDASDWLVMDARGFATQEEATVFVSKLKAATEISSIATRLGVDTGINLATSGIGQIVRDRVEQQTGI